MIVDEIGAQAVAHDSGAIVASTARDAFVYARGGRTITLPVEPLAIYYFRLPESPTWSDGTPLTPAEGQRLLDDVAATFDHWGERCEFVPPDDPRILRSLEAVVDYVRTQASA